MKRERDRLCGTSGEVKNAVVLLAMLVGGNLMVAGAGKKLPNILIITTDQQRVDAMSAVGNSWAKTPHMDSLAKNGVYFRQSYCPYPLCSPSRSSLHTGRTPHEIGVDHNSMPIDPAATLSGQVFRAAGYDTGYSGKWHMPESYPADGIAGFEVLNKGERKRKLAKDVDEATMNQAIEFLKRKRDKPFYLVVSFINPHDICLLAGDNNPIRQQVVERYLPAAGVTLPPLPENYRVSNGGPEAMSRRVGQHTQWDDNEWRRYRHAYFRLLEDVDRQVGQVLDTLRAIGQEENTLVVFTSDHGEGLGCHRLTGKMMFFEDEAAVPLIVSWKGVTPAGRIDKEHLVTAMDVLPTICDYAGVQAPANMRGTSLRGLIEKPETPGHDFVVAEMAGNKGERSFMVRTRQYKYMTFPAPPCEMLFDLNVDPDEMKNLAGAEPFAGELARHRQLLARWKEQTEEAKHPVKPLAETNRGQRRARKNAAGERPES